MSIKILGTGRYSPKKILTNHDLEKMVDTSDEWIRKRTGIVTRHIAAEGEGPVDMALNASVLALESAGCAANTLDLILCCTSTPDYIFPSVSARLGHKLGADGTPCFDISAACTGFVTALDTAEAYISSGKARRVLVVSSEKLSAVTDYTDRGTCVLFGDGAAAFVVGTTESEKLYASYLRCLGEGWEHVCAVMGQTLTMNGQEVYKFAVRAMPEAIEAVLAKAGKTLSEVRWVIPHQANLRIIESVMQKWDIPAEKVLISLPHTGNVSSAAIPALYDEYARKGEIQAGDLVLMVAFGSGLTYGAVIMEV